MSSVIKVNACVYSRIGYGRENNTSSFYMNGKFSSERHIENVQASMENRGAEYVFAVSDNMDSDYLEQENNISILKEVGRFHEKITVNGGDIRSKASELESRVNDTERLLASILEINRIPMDDTRWNLGFSGLILSDGQFAALTGGNGRIYMMRDGMFKPLASETTRAKREIDAKLQNSETDEVDVPGEEPKGSVIVSDIYDLHEGDSFLLLSDGLYQALGEEKIEDLLSLRSDSTYIAYRLVDEGMKRNSTGDLTAMVVQIEKVVETQLGSRRPASRQNSKPAVRKNVERLNRAPAVTYKYNKRNTSKYQGVVLVTLVVVTVIVLFGLLYLIISSLINTGKNSIPTPTPPAVTNTATPTQTPEDTFEPDPIETEDSVEQTPTPTPEQEIKEHVVKSGESISKIVRQYYGDIQLLDKLCKYNNIADPNKIVVGQVIKIPPKDVLEAQ